MAVLTQSLCGTHDVRFTWLARVTRGMTLKLIKLTQDKGEYRLGGQHAGRVHTKAYVKNHHYETQIVIHGCEVALADWLGRSRDRS